MQDKVEPSLWKKLAKFTWGPGLLVAPAIAFLCVTYIVPIVGLLLTSFGVNSWTTANYIDVFADASLWTVLGETLLLAFKVTLICAVLAYPLACLTLRLSERVQKIVVILMVLPLWTSVLVRAYAWMVLLGRKGIVNETMLSFGLIEKPLQLLYGEFAVLLGLVHLLLPFAYFPLLAVMKRFDQRLILAAESLGARRFSSFVLIFAPLTFPGLMSGGLIVFLHAIGYFVTPAVLGGLGQVTYVMLIEEQVNNLVNWEKAAVMAVNLLVITVVIVLTFSRYLGVDQSRLHQPLRSFRLLRAATRCVGYLAVRRNDAGISDQRMPALRSLAGRMGVAAALGSLGAVVILFLLLPIFILIPLSFSASPFLEFPPQNYSMRWYETYFSRADWITPTVNSFRIAAATMVLVIAIGGMAAIGITRARFRGAKFCLVLLLSPAMIPTLIIAVALYFQLSRAGLVGTFTGLILSHVVVAFPVVLLVLVGALNKVDQRPELAARSLGAGPIRAFMKTTFVIIRPSIIAAALFAFLASFDDVTVALFISGTNAVTLPIKMWESVRLELDPTLAAASSILIVISIAFLAVSEIAQRVAGRSRARQSGPRGVASDLKPVDR